VQVNETRHPKMWTQEVTQLHRRKPDVVVNRSFTIEMYRILMLTRNPRPLMSQMLTAEGVPIHWLRAPDGVHRILEPYCLHLPRLVISHERGPWQHLNAARNHTRGRRRKKSRRCRRATPRSHLNSRRNPMCCEARVVTGPSAANLAPRCTTADASKAECKGT